MKDETMAPPRRTRFVDAVNSGMKIADRAGLWDVPDLDKAALLQSARRETGLEDFGEDWFRQPLARLLQSLHEEAQLNPGGRWAAWQTLHKTLRDRLWTQYWFARHPEILSRPIRRPVIVVGPMRSGTTRMHRLLAADHRFSHLRSFETISPVPAPSFDPSGHDPRITLARRIMRVARLANPRTLSIHPTGPMQPEEELGLLVQSFWGMKLEAQWWVPGYGRWCEAQDALPAYRHMADLLRLIGWTQQASSLKPWVLKTPQHMLDLPALLEVFPDARVIFIHRDPGAVVGSTASLAWNQSCIYSDHADPLRIGAHWLRKTSLQVERMRRARRLIPAERRIDVHYEDMERDWQAAMERVYAFLDLEMEPALPGMERYLQACRKDTREPHCYSLGEFGLTEGDVMQALGRYVADFGIDTGPDEARIPDKRHREA